jgi:uncharacterized protein (TIGR02246 family)
MIALLAALWLVSSPATAAVGTDPVSAVAAVLDAWHAAAAAANEETYFASFTSNAVFLGTDGTERWTRDEFRKFAHPYFAKGQAWSFRSVSRHIAFSPDGKVAWFDEALATPNLGPCRGSGVLVLDGGQWKIAQYNLSVPIPNDLMGEVKKRIETYEKDRAPKAKPAS